MDNKEKVIEALSTELSSLYKKYDIFLKIQEVLKNFNGKKISKRIGTALQKEFPNDNVYYIWPDNYRPKIVFNREEFDIAPYTNDGIFDLEYFSKAYKHIEEYIVALTRLKNDHEGKLSEILAIVENFQKAKNDLEAINTKGDYIIFNTLNVRRY